MNFLIFLDLTVMISYYYLIKTIDQMQIASQFKYALCAYFRLMQNLRTFGAIKRVFNPFNQV